MLMRRVRIGLLGQRLISRPTVVEDCSFAGKPYVRVSRKSGGISHGEIQPVNSELGGIITKLSGRVCVGYDSAHGHPDSR